ncbi:hypothetical protein SAMN05660745_00008 [Corynebacterium glucuronolyticum]|nr:hypothetical protein CGLUCO_05295 [Corynebacterium glucuronolyticum DSM 44120]SMB77359.1 hypothetical protein SAMN05660745_00008 [Corynebacterium glucuronolyticum]
MVNDPESEIMRFSRFAHFLSKDSFCAFPKTSQVRYSI